MSIAWVAGTTATYVASGTTITGTLPAGIADGDGVFAFWFGRSSVTVPSGWIEVERVAFAGGGVTQTLVAMKKAEVTSADAGASLVVTQASSNRAGLTFAVLRASVGVVMVRERDSRLASNVSASLSYPPAAMRFGDGEQVLAATSGVTAAASVTSQIAPPAGASILGWTGTTLVGNRLAGFHQGLAEGAYSTDQPWTWEYAQSGWGSLALRLFDGSGVVGGDLATPSPLGAPQILGRQPSTTPQVDWIAGTEADYANAGPTLGGYLPTGLNDADGVFAFVQSRAGMTPPDGWLVLGVADFTYDGTPQHLWCLRKAQVTPADSGAWMEVALEAAEYFVAGLLFAVVRAAVARVIVAQWEQVSASEVDDFDAAPGAMTAESDGQLVLLVANGSRTNSGVSLIYGPEGALQWAGLSHVEHRLAGAYQALAPATIAGDLGPIPVGYTSTAAPFVFTIRQRGWAALGLRLLDGDVGGPLRAPPALGAPQARGARVTRGALALPLGPLGRAAVVATNGDVFGVLRDPGLPRPARLAARTWAPRGRLAGPPAFGRPAAVLWHDYGAQLAETVDTYVMDLTGTPPVRIPILSWQATQQLGRSQYLQAVVPNVGTWIAAIAQRQAGGEIVISRRARVSAALTMETVMARAPLQQVRYDRGGTNYTATLSGYSAAAQAPVYATAPRPLLGLRSTSLTDVFRARANIDWLLRPGMQAVADGRVFVCDYINYYVAGAGVDAYMDVGEHPA